MQERPGWSRQPRPGRLAVPGRGAGGGRQPRGDGGVPQPAAAQAPATRPDQHADTTLTLQLQVTTSTLLDSSITVII